MLELLAEDVYVTIIPVKPVTKNLCLLYATANSSGYALVGERSTVFDVPLNGRSSPVMQVMNNWCLLYTPSHAPVGADRQWSTVFDARLNGRESLVLPGMNNGCLLYATCAEIADPCRLCRLRTTLVSTAYANPRTGTC